MLWLDKGAVAQAGGADIAAALADIRAALDLHARGAAAMVAESVLPIGPDPRDKAYGLPARLGGAFGAAGLKWTVHRASAGPDAPANRSLTILNDLASGAPLALLDSTALTLARTAAVTALALAHFAPVPPRRIAVLGAGAQAATHLDMLAQLHPAAQLTLWNRTPAHAAALAARHPGIRVATDLDDAVTGVDAILCCTSAPRPFLTAAAVQPGRLIAQIGFDEVMPEAILGSTAVSADAWGDFAEVSAKSLFALYRAGGIGRERLAVTMLDPGWQDWQPRPTDSVYFSSFGLNLFDIALAARVHRTALANGLGQVLSGTT